MRGGKPTTRCRKCRKEYHQKYNKEVRYADVGAYKAEKARTIAKYHRLVKPGRLERKLKLVVLLGGACRECGYAVSAAALDFHHRDPGQKEHTISRILYHDRDFGKALEEAKKCDLLCSNCHREATYPGWSITPLRVPVVCQPASQD